MSVAADIWQSYSDNGPLLVLYNNLSDRSRFHAQPFFKKLNNMSVLSSVNQCSFSCFSR